MPETTDAASPQFLFAVCQAGAEAALKAEVARDWPELRPSYSRPGFVTFRMPLGDRDWLISPLSVFARTQATSLGKVTGTTAEKMADSVWNLVEGREFQVLHVWERDRQLPGTGGFEPGPTLLASEVAAKIAEAVPEGRPVPAVNPVAAAGQWVLDCVLVEPGEWWLGLHEAEIPPSRWPGGAWRTKSTVDPISRSYFKMEEALGWSRLPLERGDICAELGAAPGGSAQSLLDRGLTVLGIDPAEMDPRLAEHPQFTHVRKRAADMRRREFRGVRWLTVDVNVDPLSMLQEVEAIVTHESVHIRGMLLTLKISDWQYAEQIPAYIERIRSWGYEYTRCRQLSHNRREICVAALRKRSMRRPPKRRGSGR